MMDSTPGGARRRATMRKSNRQEMVPVRGYDKGCSLENVEFVGIAA